MKGSSSIDLHQNLIEPKTLMSIRNLELRARVVVQGFWNGLHRSPYHGFSVEFTEYRQYTPGDDPRYLDWKVYARTDRYYIKKFEDETNLRCYLLSDQSRSMDYGSGTHSKGEYAATLAATLGYFLYLQGDAVGLVTFDEVIRDYLPARYRSGHLRHLMLALEKPALGNQTNLSLPLQQILEAVRKRGLIVLISDFLAEVERLKGDLAALRASGHELVLFQVLDPAELSFPFEDAELFEDAETGQQLFIDPGAARRDYTRRFQLHAAELRAACDSIGAELHTLTTDRPLELALYDFLRSREDGRSGRGRPVQRKTTGGGIGK